MSEIKVNKISPRTACGTTTLGDSGDTFTIPAGVSITNSGTASGFGATGAVSWNTTVKTSGFTAVAGEGYFVNTTGGAVSVNLPAGTAGAVVGIKDYANTFATNAVTLVQNGSDKIGGSTVNAILTTEGIAVTLVFIDSTQGWLVTDSGLQSEAPTAEYITATGGTITNSGDYKIHTFTGPGTFNVCSVGNASGSTTIEYLVVAGGGSGGVDLGAGGGAGGFRHNFPSPDTGGLPVAATGYPVSVGAGGAIAPAPSPTVGEGNPGSNSVFSGTSTITSTGGGAGGGSNTPSPAPAAQTLGNPGGSGGGSSGYVPAQPGGSGNTPPVSPPQGNNGGLSGGGGPSYPAGGGGGAGAVGGTPGSNPSPGGVGGVGVQLNIDGNNYYWAGGGGGAAYTGVNGGAGGLGGGGGAGSDTPGSAGVGGGSAKNAGADGTAGPTGGGPVDGGAGGDNTGGGGGGGGHGGGSGSQPYNRGGTGGSGIVIIRYKFQN